MKEEIKPLDEKINYHENMYNKPLDSLSVINVKESLQNLQEELKDELDWDDDILYIIDKAFLKHIGKGLLK